MSNILNLGKDLYIKGRIGWKGLKKEEYLDSGDLKIINATALEDGYIDWDNCGFITKERYEESPEIMLQEDDILISKDGTLGKIGYVKNMKTPCSVASGIFVLRNSSKEKVNFDYLYHLLTSHIFKDFIKRNKAEGSTINHLYQRDLENFEINLPDLEIQEKVAFVLNSIDRKIQNNNKQIQTLESLAKTIYDYWFVQFDFPNEDGKPYKSSGGKMVWNEELKREIPAGWEKSFFNQLVSSQVSGDWGKESIINNHKHQIYCIRGTDFASINSSENSDIPVRYILEKNLDKRLSYGDIIIEVSGGSPTQSTGRISYITNDLLNRFDKPVLVSNFCKALRLKEPKDVFWFYHTWSRLYSSGVFFNFESKTTGIKNLMLDPVLTDLGVVIPPVFYREKFYKLVAPFYSRIQKIKSENQQLFSLKVYLLPLLMNGQVKVGKESA